MNKLEKILDKNINKKHIKQCCQCKKILTYNGYVILPDPVVKEMQISYGITHGFCPPCLEKQYTELAIFSRIQDKNINQY